MNTDKICAEIDVSRSMVIAGVPFSKGALLENSYYRKSSGVDRIRLISKACRSISDKVQCGSAPAAG
ncbi:MAG: hypothetical protein BECKG1743D_GA0114223_102893 [Candidatus Kentron sp. G]|nr:MAG: hypothetical protein BECKG1743F_GA0114225_103153 [Candidatus Kentron sp. G]VFN00682.1 MAG: hypothetical protein BECKG1743E_GA0114224_103432 [Candidatus Kentron sp. G]VFN01539.1 MAG: hypothetical protein BECKG1743D_GA0114223_102893 [Candidatus Kentron sp. G]